MATASRISDELLVSRKSFSRIHRKTGNGTPIINEGSEIRSPVWSPDQANSKTTTTYSVVPVRKVPVLYYLSRNGHLEHPHLIDIALSSPHCLYLKDVMNSLNYHRGKGMANMYSWSFKRSYKNGYVWQDASEDDVIQPTNDHDYVLKGTELHTHASQNQPETYLTGDICSSRTKAAAAVDTEAVVVKRNRSWCSFDNPQEYLVLKCESNRELAAKFAPDAATQMEEQRRPERVMVELSTEEIPSPPPSNSSSEVAEAMSGPRYVGTTAEVRDRDHQTAEDMGSTSGRMKASQVLMQLITCGTDSVRHVSPVKCKQDQGCRVSVEHGKSSRSET